VKIVAPFSRPEEVEMLVHYGADELYCGVDTPEWRAHFGNRFWMNRRSPDGGNLIAFSDIRSAVDTAHAGGVPVYLTLNAPFYPAESVGYVLRLCGKLIAGLGIDGYIVSDMNLLCYLAEMDLPVRLHLSSLGSCFNARAVPFYQSLGIRRIILPRQLRLGEIGRLVSDADGGVEFEVFAVNDGCMFEEGFCQTTHALGPFCLADWAVRAAGPEATAKETVDLDGASGHLKEYLWYQNNCGSSSTPEGLPNGPCSLCWFGRFRDWGVTAVKIVGREASFFRKMRSLQLVKAVVDAVNAGMDADAVPALARSLRKTPALCDSGQMCYFRDA
jgi:putative protease